MTQKSLLHAVAAQIANGYETAEVPMYSEHLRMPDRKVIIKIIENLQKVFFPAYFAGGTVSHVSAETFAEFLLGEIEHIANTLPEVTIVFITQRIEDILPVFDCGMILAHGRIVSSGKREEILDEEHLSCGFGLPIILFRN